MCKPKTLGILLVSALLLLAACSQRPLRDESLSLEERLATLGYHQGELVKSVWYVDVHAWQYLDKRHMVLGTGPGRAYLIGNIYRLEKLPRLKATAS